MISLAAWRKYINQLAALDKKAADQMQAWVDKNGLTDNKAMVEYAYGLATKYGEASATLSCEMYDTMSGMMKAGVPDADPAETATYEEVAKGVMWGKYHSPSQIPSIVGRQVRQAGADTMMKNAGRDQAEWAWVPQGDTCAFCIMLASNGWQKASRSVLHGNHADHIHQNCDCTFAISFKEKDKKQYEYIYDPQKYKDMYYGADGDTPNERVNYIRRQIYDRNKDEINAQKRDAYQANNLLKNVNGIRINHIKPLIESRKHPTGIPAWIAISGDPLNARQQRILDRLSNFDDRVEFNKRDVSMKDLAALTAHENVEFAMFTKGDKRLVIRGERNSVNFRYEDAEKFAEQGYRWSGHTHPGTEYEICFPSEGDRGILEIMTRTGQKYSVIYSSTGRKYVFSVNKDDDIGHKD